MCGIAGIIATGSIEPSSTDLKRLADALAHRGPDGEGLWTSPDRRAGFVHRRLAIIDTSERGNQPMVSADGSQTIVFNGEIYNFLELREELRRLGSMFRSDSDTEVILEAWRRWGEGMLLRFNGMWALAIHDNRTGDTFFSRDRFGIKPLLYTHHAGRFAFASEMRALRSLPWVDSALDPAVAQRMLFDPFSVEGSDRSIVASIRRLPAGHSAWLRQGRLTLTRWWRTTDHLVEVPRSAGEQQERFREIFFDSVRLRLRSDVPVGTCLSGGFDSTAVVCAMSHVAAGTQPHLREAQDWRHAFIASFPGKSNDETPEALEAAGYAAVTPHVLRFDDADALDQIDTVLRDLDDIYIGLTTAPWQIYRELRRARTFVSLDGHGADELMGGYLQANQAIGFALRNQAAKVLKGSGAVAQIAGSTKAAWLSARGLNFVRGHKISAPRALKIAADDDELPAHWGALNRRLYRMFHSTVLPTILRNFDRLSMASGIEVRMPFMDYRLVAYTMSLPDNAKYRDGSSKAVARDAMTGLMPEGIRAGRRKVGFNSPMPEWLNGSLGRWARELLARPDAEFDSLVDTRALLRRIDRLTAGHAWDWERAGRLWPYVHLRWQIDQRQPHP